MHFSNVLLISPHLILIINWECNLSHLKIQRVLASCLCEAKNMPIIFINVFNAEKWVFSVFKPRFSRCSFNFMEKVQLVQVCVYTFFYSTLFWFLSSHFRRFCSCVFVCLHCILQSNILPSYIRNIRWTTTSPYYIACCRVCECECEYNIQAVTCYSINSFKLDGMAQIEDRKLNK